jgi:two-component system chemotaxis sensor kinase CheA
MTDNRPQSIDRATADSAIRVNLNLLDTLMNLAGELVLSRNQLLQSLNTADIKNAVSSSHRIDLITSELQEAIMLTRMQPIGNVFNKFPRVVRDLSKKLAKKVDLTIVGKDVELDKTIIEAINDPLTHLVRNSVDHGIESPEDRTRLGKNATGRIFLKAFHEAGQVNIEISDDGAGIDGDAIATAAVRKGLISESDVSVMSTKEKVGLIFTPGFSTARQVTDVSGRGVGMDVVKTNLDKLGGIIDIDSTVGMGTVIKIKLPLTLAIIDGLLVKIGEGNFVLPLSAVEECVELGREDVDRAQNRNMLNLRGEIVSYLSLRELFHVEGEPPPMEQVVIAEAKGDRVGFGGDHVVGQHQTVIKSLGKAYRDIRGISGATILGDGTVALILDVNQIVQSQEETNT